MNVNNTIESPCSRALNAIKLSNFINKNFNARCAKEAQSAAKPLTV